VFSQGFTNQIVLVAYKQTIKVTDITLSTGFTDQIIPVICFNKCNKPIPGMGCPPNLIGQNTFGKKKHDNLNLIWRKEIRYEVARAFHSYMAFLYFSSSSL
jgi:hypothetical protein